MMIREHIYFIGRVQGVGFRFTAGYIAKELGLTGWVKNLFDGRVEMEVQGEKEKIDELIRRLKEDRFIKIDKMIVNEKECLITEHEFNMKY